MMCKGAELTFFLGFADLHLSMLWLPPVTAGTVDRITVSVDLLLDPLTGTYPGISCEVQHVYILPCFVLTLALNQLLS